MALFHDTVFRIVVGVNIKGRCTYDASGHIIEKTGCSDSDQIISKSGSGVAMNYPQTRNALTFLP